MKWIIDNLVFVVFMGTLLSGVLVIIYFGGKGIDDRAKECADRGGVLVSTFKGYACVQPIPEEKK